ncbi:MAG: pantetheine-phosphate adenylyltransferase [Treponema sp.]|jgi:pantetheine-phosphate adenylyltransferase|nr:pantetheine-phosphate adenylyltransferase [Treponema sp.]
MKAVLPGSFDPPTLGHGNLIERAAGIFDKLLVVIADNRQKSCLFSTEERVCMLKELVRPFSNVEIFVWDSLIADFMKQHNARLLVRGARNSIDFAYEFELSLMYKAIDPTIETIVIPADPHYFASRSSSIKELASFHGDVSSMTPPFVARALKARYGGNDAPPCGAVNLHLQWGKTNE